MNLYNLEKQEIDNLVSVDINNTKKYYRYKGIDFLYKKNENSNRLVIAFHGGAMRLDGIREQIPIFRLYNYKYNILCLSDKMLELYPHLHICWYLSDKASGIRDIYMEIIKSHLEKFSNVIFYGSSAGGFPALFYASYFKKKLIITNSQLYLPKWGKNFKDMLSSLQKSESELTEYTCEQVIESYGQPELSYIFCNRNDTIHLNHHYIPFKKYILDKNLERQFKFIDFIGREPIHTEGHHGIYFPDNEKLTYHLEELFNRDVLD